MSAKPALNIQTAPLVESLTSVLDQLIERHEALYSVIADKLDAMRRSKVADMLEASAREGVAADGIIKLDQQRLAIVGEIARQLKLPAASGMGVRVIAARLPAGSTARLMRSAETLREKMLAVARANRVVKLVCKEMLSHMKAVFVDLIQATSENATYSPGGAVDRPSGPQVFNTVV